MSTINPLNNPVNPNAYQPAPQSATPKKKATNAVDDPESVQNNNDPDENEDPIQWIDNALKDNDSSSSTSSNPISPTKRQRTMGNNMNNKL